MNDDAAFLIVDDDAAFAAALCRSLRRKGFAATAATSAEAALAALATAAPTNVVLDLKLGESSGLQLIPELLARAPASRILVLTGYSSIPTTVEAIKLGAVNYLCKPASAGEIVDAFGNSAADPDVALASTPPSVDRLEWEHIQRVLADNGGNISATARALGMHRRTLQRKLQKRPVSG